MSDSASNRKAKPSASDDVVIDARDKLTGAEKREALKLERQAERRAERKAERSAAEPDAVEPAETVVAQVIPKVVEPEKPNVEALAAEDKKPIAETKPVVEVTPDPKPAEKPVVAQSAAVAEPAKAPVAEPAKTPSPPAPAATPTPTSAPVAPPAAAAKVRGRHWAILTSFIVYVCLPCSFVGWYLWERAADQYASTVGFSVRTEEVSSAVELLGGITELSGSSSSDTDILYEFIQSQRMVADIDSDIDLRAMWSKPENDPYFGYDAPGTIEDLLEHWSRLVRVSYDSGTSLIEVRALAFTPEDAEAIATAIYLESQTMINQLSDIAREDSIVYSKIELDSAVEQLKEARAAVTAFRNRTQIVDPSQSVGTQTALIGNLEQQLATALIDLDLLTLTARAQDPRVVQAQLRVQVIEERIAEERRKLGIGDGGVDGDAFADLVGEFERLQVDRQFAENTYTSALASFGAAQAEARRQTRYLAAHVLPTRAEQSKFPQRDMLLALFALFNFLLWSITILVIYALKDRR